MTELENAIKDMKATDESGLIAEYLKALKDCNKEELRMLLNDVIDGGDIPLQWKESRDSMKLISNSTQATPSTIEPWSLETCC